MQPEHPRRLHAFTQNPRGRRIATDHDDLRALPRERSRHRERIPRAEFREPMATIQEPELVRIQVANRHRAFRQLSEGLETDSGDTDTTRTGDGEEPRHRPLTTGLRLAAAGRTAQMRAGRRDELPRQGCRRSSGRIETQNERRRHSGRRKRGEQPVPDRRFPHPGRSEQPHDRKHGSRPYDTPDGELASFSQPSTGPLPSLAVCGGLRLQLSRLPTWIAPTCVNAHIVIAIFNSGRLRRGLPEPSRDRETRAESPSPRCCGDAETPLPHHNSRPARLGPLPDSPTPEPYPETISVHNCTLNSHVGECAAAAGRGAGAGPVGG
ncbi:hypothetical protein DFR74_102584 [Nocardia puris]|uniref:Uncharacterized protein n=1 Tax=Nocardia puris TaxID=208602 RepID=A0A366DVQ6_9NOCA|nr:hypothetical protein DFR74_102584 [Nocardia puris]